MNERNVYMDDLMDGETGRTSSEQPGIFDEAPDFPHILFVNVATRHYETLRGLSQRTGRHLSALTREALELLFEKYHATP